MAWDDLIRDGLAIAKGIVGDGLMATVQRYAFVGLNAYAEPDWSPTPEPLPAVVTDSDERTVNERGETVVAQYQIQFLQPVTCHPRDKFVLPDGRSAPTLRVDGGALDDTGARLAVRVVCG